jgi:hypothetical protein
MWIAYGLLVSIGLLGWLAFERILNNSCHCVFCKPEGESTDKCVTCNAKKDKFSQEWDYKQCQACSMMSERSK